MRVWSGGIFLKLLFKQRLFSWLGSYDIYDEDGNVRYTVKGVPALARRLMILDAQGNELGEIRQKLLSFLPTFELYIGNSYAGSIRKELTLLKPKFFIDCNGWTIEGEWLEWDYAIRAADGSEVAVITKEVFHLTDTYVIDVRDPADALGALMVVLAIDAEKASRN